MSLRLALSGAGLRVAVVPGWESRGNSWAGGKPTGIMHHHTAAPVPFPVERLYGSLLKCNINTKPDGTVWLIAARACNYSSGPGSSVVLGEVRAGTAPTANASTRGLKDDYNANPYFFNFENDHLGHGEPLPQVQFDAIITATEVVMEYFDITHVGSVVSHAESTARKSDPYWNGNLRAIEDIRRALEMPSVEEIAQAVWDLELGPRDEKKKTRTLLRRIYNRTGDIKEMVKDLEDLDDDDLQAISVAVANELARRLTPSATGNAGPQ